MGGRASAGGNKLAVRHGLGLVLSGVPAPSLRRKNMTVEQYDILIEEAYKKREEMWQKLEDIQRELDDVSNALDLSMDEIAYLKQMRDNAIQMGEWA